MSTLIVSLKMQAPKGPTSTSFSCQPLAIVVESPLARLRGLIYLYQKLKMNKEQLINRISNSVHKSDPEAVIYLYGSRARGDNRTDSDWDLLILVDDSKITNETEDKFRDELFDIELESGQIITTLIYPKNYWENIMNVSPLYENISKEGVII